MMDKFHRSDAAAYKCGHSLQNAFLTDLSVKRIRIIFDSPGGLFPQMHFPLFMPEVIIKCND